MNELYWNFFFIAKIKDNNNFFFFNMKNKIINAVINLKMNIVLVVILSGMPCEQVTKGISQGMR